MKTRITKLLGIEYPIIQGGLAHIANGEFASAVSNAGGLGQITATSLADPSLLAREVEVARSRTSKPFAINIAMGHRPVDTFVEAALELNPVAISLTGGNPAPFVERIKAAGIKLMVLVAGARQAQKAAHLGADIIIAVGAEGGGHLGRDDIGTMVLTRKIVQSVDVPVVASGGITDGAGLLAALALGAEGIEMGTRFLGTKECPVHDNYKRALLESQEQDTRVIGRSIGAPGRVLPSSLVSQILELEDQGATLEQLLPLLSGRRNRQGALEGDMENGYVWAGQAIGLIDDIPSVKALLDRIIIDATGCYRKLNKVVE